MFSAIRLIARREILLKLQSKAIVISTAILILAAGASPWVSQLIGGEGRNVKFGTIAIDQSLVDSIEEILKGESAKVGEQYSFHEFSSVEDAKTSIRGGDIELALTANQGKLTILRGTSTRPERVEILKGAFEQLNFESFLQLAGVDSGALVRYLEAKRPLIEEVGGEKNPDDYVVALFAIAFLYLIVSLSSGFLAMTIIEEKSGRVMEVLLSSVSPRSLLGGKIVGVLIFSLIQFTAVVATWLLSSSLAGSQAIDGITGLHLFWYFLWFVPAIVTYSFLYGGFGALISRSEDAGAVQGPMSIILIASSYGAVYSLSNPDSALVEIATYLPPFNFFVAPAQLLSQGKLTAPIAIGYILALVFTFGTVRIALYLFERNALNNRRITLRRVNREVQ